MNNEKDVAQLYSEVVQSCHYHRDPSTPIVRKKYLRRERNDIRATPTIRTGKSRQLKALHKLHFSNLKLHAT